MKHVQCDLFSINISGLLILIDFQKVFDSLEWNFLLRCLESLQSHSMGFLTGLGWAVVLPILYFGSVMHTSIFDIPVLYLCFGLLSYLAFALAKFVH